MSIAGCEFCGCTTERRHGPLGKSAGRCPECGRTMFWMPNTDAERVRVARAQEATGVNRARKAITHLNGTARPL